MRISIHSVTVTISSELAMGVARKKLKHSEKII
jgi:hypothetical protein